MAGRSSLVDAPCMNPRPLTLVWYQIHGNGCVTLTVNIYAYEEIEACEMSFENDSGVSTGCNYCRVCDGDLDNMYLDIDCSNPR